MALDYPPNLRRIFLPLNMYSPLTYDRSIKLVIPASEAIGMSMLAFILPGKTTTP